VMAAVPTKTPTTPPRGILKGGSTSSKKRQRRVVWDEGNIEACEADKDSTMKVTEPKTPYNFGYLSQSDEDKSDVEMKAEAVRVTPASLDAALAEVASEQPSSSPHRVGFRDVSDDDMCPQAAPAVAAAAAAVASAEEEEEEEGRDGASDSAEAARLAERAEFERRRKLHYDEFRMVRAMRESLRASATTTDDAVAATAAAAASGDDDADDEGEHEQRSSATDVAPSASTPSSYAGDDELSDDS